MSQFQSTLAFERRKRSQAILAMRTTEAESRNASEPDRCVASSLDVTTTSSCNDFAEESGAHSEVSADTSSTTTSDVRTIKSNTVLSDATNRTRASSQAASGSASLPPMCVATAQLEQGQHASIPLASQKQDRNDNQPALGDGKEDALRSRQLGQSLIKSMTSRPSEYSVRICRTSFADCGRHEKSRNRHHYEAKISSEMVQ